MLNDVSIRTKLLLLAGLLMTGIVLMSLVGSRQASRLMDQFELFHDQGYSPAQRTLLVHKHLYKLRGDIYKLLLLPEQAEKTRKDIEKDVSRIDSEMVSLQGMKEIVGDSVRHRIGTTASTIDAYKAAVAEIVSHAGNGDLEFGKTSMKTGAAHLTRKTVDAESEALLRLLEADVERIDAQSQEIGRSTRRTLALLSAVLVLAAIAGSIAFARLVVGSLRRTAAMAERIGDGDFRIETNIAAHGKDELGTMSAKLESASAKLAAALRSVSESAGSAEQSAQAQLEMTQRLSSEADANEHEAQSASAATEEASATLQTISMNAAVSTGNLESVSAAVEEMTASVSEIARSADQTRNMTHRSLEGARTATRRMQELAVASKEIEAVIEMIVEISEQTKLLALNATIEAARAGDAGKGFAVVASEVKELAKGTAEATDDIRKRVEAIRTSTSNAVGEIDAVVQSMETLGQNISSIAGAVEEQSATTREISRNIGEAVQGNREITRNLEAGSVAIAEIARDIQNVLDRGKSLRQIAGTAKELSQRSSELSQELKREAGRFRF